MSSKNLITLDYSSSPSLAAAFAGKESGDKVTITVEFQIDEFNDTIVTGSIDEVEVEEAEDQPEIDASSPVMIVMAKADKEDDDASTGGY